MRAIEQGRYLVRAANTGISGAVDPYGRVVAKSAIFEQTGWWWTCGSCRAARSTRGSATWRRYASLAITVLALAALRRRR